MDQTADQFLDKQNIRFLDGVRGLAIFLVLLFHISYFWPRSLPRVEHFFYNFGWTGVNLFFVLSGLLITNILLNTRDKTNFFKFFYLNRILRIFPLYYLIIGILFFTVGLKEPILQALFLSNFIAAEGIRLPLYSLVAVSWSLAIEEQFYIIWPWVCKKVQLRRLSAIIIILILCPFLFKFYSIFVPLNKHFLYYNSIFRIDALALGAFLAILLREKSIDSKFIPILGALNIISLGVVAAIYFSQNTFLPFSKNNLVMGLGDSFINIFYATFILLLFQNKISICKKILELRFFVVLGKFSYGIYLSHSFVIIHLIKPMFFKNFVEANFNSPFYFYLYLVLSFAACFVTGLLLFHLFEKYFLKLKYR